jgi:hypothetical protein
MGIVLHLPDESASTRPKPSMLRALQNQSWTVHGAIAELVDNSLGKGRGAATDVWLMWDPPTRVLTVLDNGVGMTALRDLFRLGETVGRTPTDIGEYGCGGTMALLYLASEVNIWTLRNGAVAHAHMRWNDHFEAKDFPEIPTTWKRATGRNTPASLWRNGHGTWIELKILKRRKVSESNIRRDLSALYAPAVRNGCTLQWVTSGQTVIDLSDPMTGMENTQDFNLTLEVPGGDGIRHLHVHGLVGTIKELPIERSRIAVSFHHRVIQWTRDCYSHSSGRKYPGVGLCGWLHLDDSWQGLLATTKDSIDDGEAWTVLMDAVFVRIEALLKQLQHEKQTLLLDGITLELQEMFADGKTPAPALYGEPSSDGPIEGPGDDEPGDGEGGRGDRGSRGPRTRGDKEGGTSSMASVLEITYLSDAEMKGCLSKAAVTFFRDDTTGVNAFINRDHGVIQIALEQHPVNRMCLATLVAQAVAYQVCIHPGVLKAWFGRRLAEYIENLESENRGPYVLRLLMDRFRDRTATVRH